MQCLVESRNSTAVTQNNNFSKALSTIDKVADLQDSTVQKNR